MAKILTQFLLFLIINNSLVTSSRIKIENNGYEDILIALPSSIIPEKRTPLVSSLTRLFQQSSDVLQNATKGRAKFQSVSFLVPNEWGSIDGWFPNRNKKTIVLEEPKATHSKEEADIIITNPDEELYPYTLHHQGCGKQSHRIYLSSNFSTDGNLLERTTEFVRLWAEFRYGTFPEGGFEDDNRYPHTYPDPRSRIIQNTGCVNQPFRVPQECDTRWNCDGNQITPSIMDQHYTNGTHFCEGHTSLGQIHNPEAPTKHNLLCNEEGTYYSILRSPDFKHGKNSPPRNQTEREIIFRYIKEMKSENVIVTIDVSSQMKIQDRFSAVKNAFSRFVYLDLPNGSNLSLVVFGGDENMTFVTSERLIDGIESRISYLESQPLPEDASTSEISCPECALSNILDHMKNHSNPDARVILITTKLYIDDVMYANIVEDLKQSETKLHVFMFTNTASTSTNQFNWFTLCKETGNNFVHLGNNYLGNLYKGFSTAVQSTTKDSQIIQDYLNTLDEEVLHFSIPVEVSITKSLIISLSAPGFNTDPIKYDSTVLKDPENEITHPQKQELIPAWIFNVSNPKEGIYSLRTWRKRGATSPILITVTGQSTTKQEAIEARVWTEKVEADTKLSQPPIIIFGEVRKGPYPIVNATVKAYVIHPNNNHVSEVELFDDGIGSTDITKNDGIYSRYFTNFSSVGFYSVSIKVTGGIDSPAVVLKGPSSYCCGSTFPHTQQSGIAQFAREAGPVTFEVTSVPIHDIYPPSRVTDLSITRSYDDQLYILQWTAVGNNYDHGVASAYEIKIFRDRSLVRNRFFNSGLEVYNVTVETTEEASYGTQLYHTLTLMETFENGLYYIGIRAVDESGNYGEPSNIVSVLLHSKTQSKFIDCPANEPLALQFNSAIENSLPNIFLYIFAICMFNIFVPHH